MEPASEGARCPACGRVERGATARLPLFILVGASGVGKTTLFPLLAEELRGACAVFDVDWLIDPLRRTPDAPLDLPYWQVFRDTWLHVAHAVAQNGLPTLLLSSFIPEHLDGLHIRRWMSDVSYAVLDCSDQERRARVQSRPRWGAVGLDEQPEFAARQLEFAAWLREHLSPVFDTTDVSPTETAKAVAGWVRQELLP
jgi:hypothetical protein